MALSTLALLLQDAAQQPESGGAQGTIKIVAGVLALVLVILIVMRRKGGARKKEDDEF